MYCRKGAFYFVVLIKITFTNLYDVGTDSFTHCGVKLNRLICSFETTCWFEMDGRHKNALNLFVD